MSSGFPWGGSKFSGELKFHEIGPKLSILDILLTLEVSERNLIARQLIIDEQARAIAKLEKHVAELLELLRRNARLEGGPV